MTAVVQVDGQAGKSQRGAQGATCTGARRTEHASSPSDFLWRGRLERARRQMPISLKGSASQKATRLAGCGAWESPEGVKKTGGFRSLESVGRVVPLVDILANTPAPKEGFSGLPSSPWPATGSMSGLVTGHMSPNWTFPRVTIDSRLEHQANLDFTQKQASTVQRQMAWLSTMLLGVGAMAVWSFIT